jgi:hypothetical protein
VARRAVHAFPGSGTILTSSIVYKVTSIDKIKFQ